ncbi:hypothetical protein PENSPDRAFT_749639 [Peniophora sp. CONT]|nr:hypothetical protein PENSPDRAFT_749639 [Peniophora sp. CONT]
MHETHRYEHCQHDILGPSPEGYSTRHVSQDELLDFMTELGFSKAFCRRPTQPRSLPIYVEGDFSASVHSPPLAQSGLYKRLHITTTYSWDISPEADNVAALVRALTYRVHPEGVLGSLSCPAFRDIPHPSADDDVNGLSLADIFETHKSNLSSFDAVLVREPHKFVEMANTLFVQSDLDNVQLWDCVYLIEQLATAQVDGGPPELVDAWERLIEAGLSDTLVPLFCHLHHTAVMLAIMKITQCVMQSHSGVANELRFQTSPALKRVFEEFWLHLGRHVTIIRGIGDTEGFGLVYHESEPIVYAIHVRSQLFALTMYCLLVAVYPNVDIGIRPQIYRMICRAGLLCWFYPDCVPPDLDAEVDGQFKYTVVFPGYFLSVYATSSEASGLTELDLDTFVREDIIGEYGAEAFIVRFTNDVLIDLRGKVHTVKHFNDLNASIRNAKHILVHPEFRRYYTSSGFIQALCDVAEYPRLRRYSHPPEVERSQECTHSRRLNRRALLDSSSIAHAAKPLLRSGILPVLAQSSILFAQAGRENDRECLYLLDNAVEPFMIIAGGARARGSERDQELFDAIEQSIKPDWYPTIHVLRDLSSRDGESPGRCKQMIKVWTDLGNALGLQEKKEKARYERERKRVAQLCAWEECEFHQVTPPTSTRACAGCGEVRYCSRACQQTDWAKGGHKRQCKRLKSEAYVPHTRV